MIQKPRPLIFWFLVVGIAWSLFLYALVAEENHARGIPYAPPTSAVTGKPPQ